MKIGEPIKTGEMIIEITEVVEVTEEEGIITAEKSKTMMIKPWMTTETTEVLGATGAREATTRPEALQEGTKTRGGTATRTKTAATSAEATALKLKTVMLEGATVREGVRTGISVAGTRETGITEITRTKTKLKTQVTMQTVQLIILKMRAAAPKVTIEGEGEENLLDFQIRGKITTGREEVNYFIISKKLEVLFELSCLY